MDERILRQDTPVDGSRRSFLVRTAAVAGIGAVVSALGKSGCATNAARPTTIGAPVKPPHRDEPVRLGVIGTGGMGRGHCSAFIRNAQSGDENVRIVAISDVWKQNLERAYRMCAEGQDGVEVSRYHDYREMLARDDIHGVVIASPEHWHAQMGIDAILAGKDVYVEKPMTLRLDEALELRRYVKANPQVMFVVGTQMIQQPKYHSARELIRAGEYGPVTFSQTSYCRNSETGEWNYYPVDESWRPGVDVDWEAWCGPLGPHPWDPYVLSRWRRYRAFSTGIVGDLLVHVLTPLILAVDSGWPTRVVATGSHLVDKEMENHDQVNLIVQFENGHVMTIAGSTCNEVGLETMIRSHKANIYLGGRHCVVRPERIFSDRIDGKTVESPDIGNDQERHRRSWLQSIRTRHQPESGIELGTKVMVIVDLATRSMWEGGAFEFDPRTMRVRRA